MLPPFLEVPLPSISYHLCPYIKINVKRNKYKYKKCGLTFFLGLAHFLQFFSVYFYWYTSAGYFLCFTRGLLILFDFFQRDNIWFDWFYILFMTYIEGPLCHWHRRSFPLLTHVEAHLHHWQTWMVLLVTGIEGHLHLLFLFVSLSVPYLIVLCKTSSSVMNGSEESWSPCLVPRLGENVLSLCI